MGGASVSLIASNIMLFECFFSLKRLFERGKTEKLQHASDTNSPMTCGGHHSALNA